MASNERGPSDGAASTPASAEDVESETPLSGTDVTTPQSENLLLEMRRPLAETLASGVYEVEDHYWLNRPFAYAAILYDKRTTDRTYRVIEPSLAEHEARLYDDLQQQIQDELLYRIPAGTDPDERERRVEDSVRDVIEDYSGFEVPEPSLRKVLYYLKRDLLHYGKIDPLMHDPRLEEISCNGPTSPIYIYHRDYENLETNIVYEKEELRPFIKKLAQRSGKDISTANPMQGTSLPDGSRVQLELEEVAPRGENFTIRKFRETPFTPIDLINYGTFSLEQMAYLWLLVENGESGIIAGGTGSGKTTTLNALSLFLPPKNKVVSIEDTREIQIPQQNWVANLTREGYSQRDEAGIDMYALLEAALRKRPEYIIVGEVRGEEGRDLFQAMNTGHTTYSTLHADSVQTVFNRLENPPISVERELIAELGFVSIQTVAHVEDESGEKRKVRRNNELVEILGLDPETREMNIRRMFEWDESTDTIEKVADSYHAERLREMGRTPEQSFKERYRVLEYLLENGIDGYQPVSTVVRGYMIAPNIVLEQIEEGEIDFEELKSLGRTYASE